MNLKKRVNKLLTNPDVPDRHPIPLDKIERIRGEGCTYYIIALAWTWLHEENADENRVVYALAVTDVGIKEDDLPLLPPLYLLSAISLTKDGVDFKNLGTPYHIGWIDRWIKENINSLIRGVFRAGKAAVKK